MTLAEETETGPAEDDGLLDLERRHARLAREVETLDRVERNALLGRLERDLCTYQCEAARVAGAREHPVLGVALGWEERLRRAEAKDDARAVETLAAEILIRGLRARERRALDVLELGPNDVARSLDGATRDRLFDGLLGVEELRQRVEGRASRLGTSEDADARAVCEEATRVQAVLRDALVRAVEALPPDAEKRREWAGKLVDLADETVLAAGERSPRVAQRQLGETRRALRWHLQHVETGPTEERKRLRRRERRTDAERIEQDLQSKLEGRFGERAVELWERGVLVALLLVVVLLLVDLTRGSSTWLVVVDTLICGFFLVDFTVKAAMVRFHPTWLKRHVITDLVPALPFAWLASLDGGNTRGPQRVFLLGRLPKVIKASLPLLRLFRAFSFLVRGLDRLVRRNSRLLENEILVFPTSLERQRSRESRGSDDARVWRLRGNLDGLFEQLHEEAQPEERQRLAQLRLAAFRDAAKILVEPRDNATEGTKRRQALPLADRWLRRMSSIRSEEVEGRVGTEAVRRIARGARMVARSPLRYAFLLGRWAPADAADLPDRRVASRTVRNVTRSLANLHRRVLWWADLRGTLTPGELVGRVGSTLVARTARPAFRLLMLGGAYLLFVMTLDLLGFNVNVEDGVDLTWYQAILRWFEQVVGVALIAIGSVCLLILAVGVWLQRMARDSTMFHERVARAQFLHLTDSIKSRQLELDSELLAERVYSLERNLFEDDGAREATERDRARFLRHLERFLCKGVSPPSRDEGFDPVARSVMLHRDLLDGALLAHSDTRATSQMLGNLSLQRMARKSARVGRARLRAWLSIDLERRRTFVRGPYLWFHAISHALSSRAARLIVDYNANAIPLSELDRTRPEDRQRYERWLAGALRGEAPASGEPVEADSEEELGEAPQLTTAFTVLHFLDDAQARDAEVEKRFGERVVERLRRDRRALVRTVFGTYPLHRMPLESRVFNLRALYSEWVEGGRVLFVPLRLAWLGVRLGARAFKALMRAVAAIRRPELALAALGEAEADFTAAARKIDRMRGPGALAALHLRALLDTEYHGLALPFGLYDSEEAEDSARSAAQRDAEFLDANPAFLDELAALRSRAQRNIARLEDAAERGLVERVGEALATDVRAEPATARALVSLVHTDEDGLRADLFGLDVLSEVTIDALEFGLPEVGPVLPLPLWLSFRTWWTREGGREHVTEAVRRAGVISFEPSEEAASTPSRRKSFQRSLARRIRRAAWRSVQADEDGARAALAAVRARIARGESEADGRARAEQRLVDALRHPARVTEQLVTLRTIQTLSLVDVRNYRRHVWSVGQYEEEGDVAGVLLDVPAC